MGKCWLTAQHDVLSMYQGIVLSAVSFVEGMTQSKVYLLRTMMQITSMRLSSPIRVLSPKENEWRNSQQETRRKYKDFLERGILGSIDMPSEFIRKRIKYKCVNIFLWKIIYFGMIEEHSIWVVIQSIHFKTTFNRLPKNNGRQCTTSSSMNKWKRNGIQIMLAEIYTTKLFIHSLFTWSALIDVIVSVGQELGINLLTCF